jgi:D-3-phosphoglycerate dehydrogenase
MEGETILAKILIVQPIAKEATQLLIDEGFEVKELENHSVEIAMKEVVDVDAIIVRNGEIPREVIERANNLKVISRHGVGLEHIDVEAATEKGIYVTNAPIANSVSVVEHVIGMMLALAKNLITVDKALRKGRFEIRHECYGIELESKTLSIIGLGNVGRRLALKAVKGLGMRVIGFDPYVSTGDIDPDVEITDDWERVFREGDFVSLNLPLNDKTIGIVGVNEFKMMKKTAYLINCARGPIVKEPELIEALKEGLIAGAGIDVYSEDPPAKDNPLFFMENTIVTPHTAAHTDEAMKKMAMHAAQGVIEVLRNKVPTWPVNRIYI